MEVNNLYINYQHDEKEIERLKTVKNYPFMYSWNYDEVFKATDLFLQHLLSSILTRKECARVLAMFILGFRDE